MRRNLYDDSTANIRRESFLSFAVERIHNAITDPTVFNPILIYFRDDRFFSIEREHLETY